MSRSEPRTPKQSGEAIEALVLERVDGLAPATDADRQGFDAVADATLCPRTTNVRFATPVVEAGTEVEIKACQTRLASGSRGRWYLRERQHERLLATGGAYLLVVYAPTFPRHEVRGMALVPASLIDELLPDGWVAVEGDRAETGYRQLSWSRVLESGDVQEGRR